MALKTERLGYQVWSEPDKESEAQIVRKAGAGWSTGDERYTVVYILLRNKSEKEDLA